MHTCNANYSSNYLITFTISLCNYQNIDLLHKISFLLREMKLVSLVSSLSCFMFSFNISLEIQHSVFGDLIVYTSLSHTHTHALTISIFFLFRVYPISASIEERSPDASELTQMANRRKWGISLVAAVLSLLHF